MQEAKRVAKNTGILYIQMGITVFMSLYATRVVLAALGVEDFGIFNLVGGAIAMLTFLNAAMTSASQRFMSFAQGQGDVEKQKKIFNISVLLHLIIAIAVVALLEVVGVFLFDSVFKISPERIEIAKLIFQFLIVSTFFAIISVPYDAVINAHENMLLVAILRIVEVTMKLSIAFYITYTSFDKLLIYGLLMACLSVFLLIVRQLYCRNKYQEAVINFKKYYCKSLFKEMTSFASWSFLGSSSSMLSNYGQGIVVNIFFGTKVNAAQGISGQVSGQLSAFAGTMMKALNPIIAKSEGAGDRKLMLKATFVGSKISFFLLMIFYIPVIIEMPYIFNLWLKEVPEYAVIFCRLLLLRNLIEQMLITLNASIAAVGNIRQFQTFKSIFAFMPLLVSYILFSFNYEPYWLYLVFIVFSLVDGAIILFFARKECGLSISLYFKEVLIICITSFIIVFIITSIPNYYMPIGIERLLLVIFTSLFSFLVTIILFGLSKNERTVFIRIIKKYLKK